MCDIVLIGPWGPLDYVFDMKYPYALVNRNIIFPHLVPQCYCSIRITCPCDLLPRVPHFYIVKLGFTGVYITPRFYIVKLGFTGVYIIFLFLLKNIYCGYSLGGSNVYPQYMF